MEVEIPSAVLHDANMTQQMTSDQLEDYILNQMRMSHVYQPAMLKVLLENGGHATVEDIAKGLLEHDRSQVEYYAIRTKNMVGKVLTQNGIVELIKEGRSIVGYRLNADSLTDAQRASLTALCDQRLSDFIQQRGEALYAHRRPSDGYVPGSMRYEVLKRAKYRCELCGAHEDQIALHVDHIIPRAKGGSDDLSNLQALCMTCNTNKRDNDDTDFRGILDSYEDREEGCLFCEIGSKRILDENELAYAIRDGFPVTDLHTLIIPKRHVADYFDLYQPELNAIHALLSDQKDSIQSYDPEVVGFNVGVNSGEAAGQTIFHVHVHLIPRRSGDVTEPRGGVRGVIPGKQSY
ncbi:HIT domain-containing protein [Nioella aestuarii]|uniref:HIT domain-containing protein n=1 Tax=Nioella aestuarii TaxID=1662864 RepID=UPI003D7F4DB1